MSEKIHLELACIEEQLGKIDDSQPILRQLLLIWHERIAECVELMNKKEAANAVETTK